MTAHRPILGISIGDPAGIGPEVCLKALGHPRVYQICRPLLVGDASCLRATSERLSCLPVHAVSSLSQANFKHGTVDVLDLQNVDLSQMQIGSVSAASGDAAFQAVKTVIELALANQIDATVTGPISKEAIQLAGHPYAGHTEIYADLTNTKDYCMMLVHDTIRVLHVSTHVSLRRACDLVKKERILTLIRYAEKACREFGIEKPKIAVAGLNPHAGENGLFGEEEINEIIPAIHAGLSEGFLVEGPIPPDSVFPKAAGGIYDIVIAMYHDQGHIPAKLSGFHWDPAAHRWATINGINITLGLPIIRSSVDHGTAFDIAGKGIASEDSMLSAIEAAVVMANVRREALA